MKEQIGDSFEDVFKELESNPEYQKERRRLRPYYDLIVDVIRRRSELGLTQKELAERAGTHQSRISKIESAEMDMRLSTLIEIAEALETELDIHLKPIEKAQINQDQDPGLVRELFAYLESSVEVKDFAPSGIANLIVRSISVSSSG